MVEIKNLSKEYQNSYVLKDINLDLEEKGLTMIVGPSGSGKSTLLNCISGLTPYEGVIRIDGKNFGALPENQKSEFRLHEIGFVFQDFKLFENDTVYNNVILPLEVIDKTKKEFNDQEVKSILNMCGITNLKDSFVSDLSGGEKQRVAIARALISKPKLLLCDEPTGSLDKENAKGVMELLKSISLKKLVIMVTHDLTLVETYPDQVIYLKDGQVEKVETCNYEIVTKTLLQARKEVPSKEAKLPVRFIRSHIKQYNHRKKWRSGLSKMVISLGLVGVGLAFVISECVSGIITSSYSQLIDEDQIIIDDTSFYSKFTDIDALSYSSSKEYMSLYPEYIDDIGVTYLVNFSEFFPDTNELCVDGLSANLPTDRPFGNFSAAMFNDFIWLDKYTPSTVYPSLPSALSDNQVVLGLSISSLRSLCLQLEIARSVASLNDYILNNQLNIFLNVAHYEWGKYYDEQLFEVVGFAITDQDCLYHYNHLWNEYVFESLMKLPSSLEINSSHEYPWTMEKVYYYECGDNIESMIDLCNQEKRLQLVFYDVGNRNYFARFNDYPDIYSNRLLLYENNETYISPYIGNQILDLDSNIESIIYGSDMGYAIYGNYYMSGFARETYFSFDYDTLFDFTGEITYYPYLENIKFNLPDGVLEGYYTLVSSEGVTFVPIDNKQISVGTYPMGNDEVVVSSGLLTKLGLDTSVVPTSPLYLRYNYEETYQANNYVRKSFRDGELKIVGIIDNENPILYQYSTWVITFFTSRMHVSTFNLIPHSVSLTSSDSTKLDDSLKILKSYFPSFSVYSPLRDLTDSVREVTNYITIGILIFSVVAIIASALLIYIVTNFLIIENKKEFGLLRCLGINGKESFKLVVGYSLNLSLSSFIISFFELLVVVFVFQFIYDALTFSLSFLYAIICMFVVSLGISLLAAFLNYKKIINLNPLDALKR